MKLTPRSMAMVLVLLAGLSGCGDSWSPFGESSSNREIRKTRADAEIHQHMTEAQSKYSAGDYDAALEELVKALRLNPRNPGALVACGDVFRKKGDYPRAKVQYSAACKSDPYSFPAHYKLGITYQALADLADKLSDVSDYLHAAVKTYIRAINIDPKSFNAHLNLGTCYFQLDQKALALQTTYQAVKLNPTSYQAYTNYGLIAEYMADYDTAIRAYKTSIELNGNQPRILLNLASAYMRQNKFRSAMNTLRQAVKMRPEDADAWLYLGVCCFRQKEFPAAIEAFQNAIRNNPNLPGAYRGLGVICMYQYVSDRDRSDLRDMALRAWDYSLKLDPNQTDLRELVNIYRNEAAASATPVEEVATEPQASSPPATANSTDSTTAETAPVSTAPKAPAVAEPIQPVQPVGQPIQSPHQPIGPVQPSKPAPKTLESQTPAAGWE